jgi:hypothetical protein
MKTILPWVFWFLVGAAVFAMFRSGKVFAEPFIAAEQNGVRIAVYTEPCVLKEVTNLQRRATWTENGKVIEGCAGYFPQIELVLFYFADKTVVPVPSSFFQKVSGA